MSENKTPTALGLIKEIAALAEKYPENWYNSPMPGTASDCSYLRGSNSETKQLGCIVGQALQRCGVTKEQLEPIEYNGINGVSDYIGLADAEQQFVNWLSFVQSKQDRRTPWKNAVREADEMYPSVATLRQQA